MHPSQREQFTIPIPNGDESIRGAMVNDRVTLNGRTTHEQSHAFALALVDPRGREDLTALEDA